IADSTSDRRPSKSASEQHVRTRPSEIQPMRARIGDLDSVRRDAEDWAFEMKWDGIRALATVRAAGGASPGEVVLTSRNGKDMTGTYPELAELSDCVDADCVLDGDIVALGPGSRPDFGRLQHRMGLSRARDVERERGRTPVHLMVFDLLEAGDDSLLRVPYADRRQRLRDHVSEGE